ncbi:MAG: GNAT family N-acetyltransferase [Planctomycetota bacterium]
MIAYREDVSGLRPEHLGGFFVGWPKAPSRDSHLRLLRNSDHVALAWDSDTRRVVGFATALTDGVLVASIPLLEVLPDHQGRGIGKALVTRLLTRLDDLYAIDLVCDEPLVPFYESLGFGRGVAMSIRRYDRQAGA